MNEDKDILSIDSDDDNENYNAFFEYLEDDTQRKKRKTANEIDELGEQFLLEVERKKKNKILKSKKLIPYILKHSGEKYSENELLEYSFEDVQNIYNEIRVEKRPVIVKFLHFIFNI
jgi:hypothetical protein